MCINHKLVLPVLACTANSFYENVLDARLILFLICRTLGFSEFFKTLKFVKYKCIFFLAIFVEKQHLSAENRHYIEIYR